MYANYHTLFLSNSCPGGAQDAITDSSRISCPSLPWQPMVRSSIQSSLEHAPDVLDTYPQPADDMSPVGCGYQCGMRENFVEEATPPPRRPPRTAISMLSPASHITTMTPTPKAKEMATPKAESQTGLLPVMETRFNLREICKQSILLEDHLSQSDKRCTDCCIKHFLTIEALAEEAITLDKEGRYMEIRDLPIRIRVLQDEWFRDMDGNAHSVSQKLREIRKQYQIDCFDIIFQEKECGSCIGGVCKIPKTK